MKDPKPTRRADWKESQGMGLRLEAAILKRWRPNQAARTKFGERAEQTRGW